MTTTNDVGGGIVNRLDEGSFEALYQAHYAGLVTLGTATIKDRGLAEDMVQDAFATLWRKRDEVREPLAWLRRVVVTNCLDAVRTRNRRTAILKRQPPPEAVTQPARVEFEAMLQGLTERQRAIVCLRYLDDLSIEEIARTLECRPGTVKSSIHRANTQMRHTFSQQEWS